jgi:hypothetical protein
MTVAEKAAAMADAELAKLYADTGIDLSMLPSIMTAEARPGDPQQRRRVGAETATATAASHTSGWAGASAMCGADITRYLAAHRSAAADIGGRSTKRND